MIFLALKDKASEPRVGEIVYVTYPDRETGEERTVRMPITRVTDTYVKIEEEKAPDGIAEPRARAPGRPGPRVRRRHRHV